MHPNPIARRVSFDQSFIAPEAERYVQAHAPLPYRVMERLEREAAKEGQPAVGRTTGSALRALVAATPARRVLEVGTNLGYSALWMASALATGGTLDTIEIDPDLAKRAESAFAEAGLAGHARVHLGAALDVLPRLAGPYDLVFLDAVKSEYGAYLDLALPRLAPGGILAADNMFWSGRAWGPDVGDSLDEETRGVRAYMRRVADDARLVTTLLPVEDGLAVSVLRRS